MIETANFECLPTVKTWPDSINQNYVVGFFVKQCTQGIVMSGLKLEDIHLLKVLQIMNMIYHAMGLVI